MNQEDLDLAVTNVKFGMSLGVLSSDVVLMIAGQMEREGHEIEAEVLRIAIRDLQEGDDFEPIMSRAEAINQLETDAKNRDLKGDHQGAMNLRTAAGIARSYEEK